MANCRETKPNIGLDGPRVVDVDGQLGSQGSLYAPHALDRDRSLTEIRLADQYIHQHRFALSR